MAEQVLCKRDFSLLGEGLRLFVKLVKQEWQLTLIGSLLALGVLSKLIFDLATVPDVRVHVVYVEVLLGFSLLAGFSGTRWQSSRIGVCLFVLWLVLSCWATLASDHFYPSLWHQAELLLLVALLPLLSVFLQRNQNAVLVLTLVVLAAFMVTAVAELVQWFRLDDPATYNWIGFDVFYSYLHVRHFGDMATICVFIACYFIGREGMALPWLGFVALVISATVLFFSGGRASILSTVFLVLLLLLIAAGSRRFVLGVFAALIIGYLLASVFSSGSSVVGPARAVDLFAQVPFVSEAVADDELEQNNLEIKTSGRNMFWKQTLDILDSHPWLGTGPDTYIFIQPALWGQTPHNTLLQFALDWGWPAAAIAFGFTCYLLWCAGQQIWRLRSEWDIASFWGLAYVVFFIHGLVATTFYEPVNLLMVLVMSAILLSSKSPSSFTSSGAGIRIPMKLAIGMLVATLILNLVVHQVFRTDIRLAKGRHTGSISEWMYFNWPFVSDRFHQGLHHMVKRDTHNELFYLEWGERNTPYVSWYFTAHKAKYYHDHGDRALAYVALERAQEKAGKKAPQVHRIVGFPVN